MKIGIVSLSLILFSLLSYSQKQGNIWYFGNHAGLNFNYSPPVVLTDGATYNAPVELNSEGTAVICDSSGSLLFYTNGEKVWDKNHQVMPNGDGLLSNLSSTQAALILPQPGNNQYYYVFTTDDFDVNSLKYGFRYSVVDMCLNNETGDVTMEKNILLLDTVAEKLTAVKHENGIDYWVIIHKYYSDSFYSYLLTSSGVSGPVVSSIGSIHPAGFVGVGSAIGQLKASPDGNKLAIVNGNSSNSVAEYFDFNKSTGTVSNCISIQTNPIYNYYGVSFSPDNSKLYISCWLNNIGTYQFDLNAGNSAAIIASKTLIADWGYFGMQLGVDGKIYLARVGEYLSVINNPNETGVNCNYLDSAIYLEGMKCSFGLPNFLDSYQYHNQLACADYVPEDIIIPNVFTPNSDNINDTFIIENLPEGSTVQIYNRWGALVAEWDKPDGSWGGRTKGGSQVSGGVYYYIVMLPYGERKKGFVQLFR